MLFSHKQMAVNLGFGLKIIALGTAMNIIRNVLTQHGKQITNFLFYSVKEIARVASISNRFSNGMPF